MNKIFGKKGKKTCIGMDLIHHLIGIERPEIYSEKSTLSEKKLINEVLIPFGLDKSIHVMFYAIYSIQSQNDYWVVINVIEK
jgi:hypothetical protein